MTGAHRGGLSLATSPFSAACRTGAAGPAHADLARQARTRPADSWAVAAQRLIKLRWDGICATCGAFAPAGTQAWYDAATRKVHCEGCAAPPALAPDTPGASAARRYDELKTRREERAREQFGRLGAASARALGPPQHIEAWREGAAGERRVADRLGKHLKDKEVVLLHDRRIPGGRANIDHLAVGPGGVTVIDAKSHIADVRVVERGGILSPRETRLMIGRFDRSSLVAGVLRQAERVKA